MTRTDSLEIERSNGNVFADLRLPDPDTHLLKAELITQIDEIIRKRGLDHAETAELFGLSQDDVSLLLRGGFTEHSMGRLQCLLTALESDIGIVVRS